MQPSLGQLVSGLRQPAETQPLHGMVVLRSQAALRRPPAAEIQPADGDDAPTDDLIEPAWCAAMHAPHRLQLFDRLTKLKLLSRVAVFGKAPSGHKLVLLRLQQGLCRDRPRCTRATVGLVAFVGDHTVHDPMCL